MFSIMISRNAFENKKQDIVLITREPVVVQDFVWLYNYMYQDFIQLNVQTDYNKIFFIK